MMISLPTVSLPLRFALEYMLDGRTPMRALSDAMMTAGAQELSKTYKTALELGSGGDYYKKMLAGTIVVETSNIVPGCDLVIDMTNIDLPSGSRDLILSAFAIEHFFDVDRSFSEVSRVLSDDGVYFLIAPFLYFYHAAPDDYFRFTGSALRRFAERHGLEVDSEVALGDRWLMFGEFLHEKAVLGSKHGAMTRAFFRLLALPALVFSILRGKGDPRFAMGFAVLLRKRRSGSGGPT